MKKLFTLACALFGLTATMNAATVDDVKVLKHSYVLVCDDWNNKGSEKIAANALFGDDYFFTPTGNDKSTGKGVTDLSTVDENGYVTEEIVAKYGEYGSHLNSLRLKNNQDIIVMKVTAKSKIIFFLQGNNTSGTSARIPKLWDGKNITKKDDCKDDNALNPKPTADHPSVIAGFKYEYVAPDDMTLWVGSWNGDMFLSYVIVEANEAPGTPTVKVGPQTYEGGLWFKEVTCKANDMVEEGSTESIPTVVTYTTDGSTPTAASTVYTEPIKCYENMVVKFQAFMDFGSGKAEEGMEADGADNEAAVNFKFDAPSIVADGANVSIVSPYEGADNYYIIGTADAVKGSEFTLEESASITAYSQIVNGKYTTFTTGNSFKDVYVLNPIKEKKTVQVTAGDVVVDEEATAGATDGSTIYKVENGEISADKKDFFVKDLEFAVVKDEKYQIEGEERYIKMNNTNITFEVAEGDSVDVKVICSKNSCKMLDNEDETKIDRQCKVNVSDTTYGNDDVTAENGNVIEFGLTGGKVYTFKKFSGTGNIMIYSIEITPVNTVGISNTVAAEKASEKTVKVLKDGRLIIKKGDVEFNVSGVQMK